MTGPLHGLRVIEFTGLGPAPLAGQMLADLGADVTTIDRKPAKLDPGDVNRRGKTSIVLNLKSEGGLNAAKQLISKADVVIEGFRPGVMEKLGLGPSDLADDLIYARMTGWGQTGPVAMTAGHDLTYLAMTGMLHMMGEAGKPPTPPLNLVADFGGGTMFLLLGIMAALYERQTSGKGQVIDAAMVDGVSAFMGLFSRFRHAGSWTDQRADNTLDGGAPFYRCFETSDGGYLAVAPLEPQFFAELCAKAGLPDEDMKRQYDKTHWPDMHARYEALFKTKTRDEWAAIFDGSDACVAPVLRPDEAPEDPHMAARGAQVWNDGVLHPAPAPRFSRSAPGTPGPVGAPGADTAQVLRDAGFSDDEITALQASGDAT